MISIEPATIGGCGYPDLLATGELCDRDSFHDRQHQHDLLMEVAADYDCPLRGNLRWQLYGVGGLASLGFVPESLKPHYGRRANPGVGLFVTVRPATHKM